MSVSDARSASLPKAEQQPLVTIGIPTYNRPDELTRAVRSALVQDYGRIEVLISDNASPDPAVPPLGHQLAADDPRVRFIRQPRNAGHAANYQYVLEHAGGDYFMWLADDDWLDPQYVSRCLDALVHDATAILVCGLARYYADGAHLLDERPTNLDSHRPGARVIRYFGRVSLNGSMFGVARRADLLPVGFPLTIGGDWLVIATLAAQGRVLTLDDVHIHRSLGGMGADPESLTHDLGVRGITAGQHHVAVAARTWREIARGATGFGGLRFPARVCVATAAGVLIVSRFTLAAMVRSALGTDRAAALELRISAWLRRREAE